VAAVIVTVLGSIAFSRRGQAPDLKISGRVTGTPTPTAQRPAAPESGAPQMNFLGAGSWTMSALPSCFRERERLRGPLAQLRPKFPPAAERVPPASIVRSGDCTILVGRNDLQISRGRDRLRVPPDAALYRDANGLTLVSIDGSRAEIRRY